MREPLFYFTLLFVCINLSCKSQRYTVEDLPEKQLVFGKGGGMTGAVDTYTLLENGQLFHLNSIIKVHNELKGITKKEAKAHFEKIGSLALTEIDFDRPGNIYYFLEEVNGEEKNRVTWGSQDHEIPEACQSLYNELKNILK